MRIIADYSTGSRVYAIILNCNGLIWRDDATAFEAIDDEYWTRYAVPLREQGTASGIYTADVPGGIAAGIYTVFTLQQTGNTVAISDPKLRVGSLAV